MSQECTGDGGCHKNAPVTGMSQEDPAVAHKHGMNQLGGLVVSEETVGAQLRGPKTWLRQEAPGT